MITAATEIDFPSGPWVGFHQLQGRSLPQQLQLDFADGEVHGGGCDHRGEFAIHGSYDLDSREVRMTKTYVDGRTLECRGFREGEGIWGVWTMPGEGRSGFHIWPQDGRGD